MVYHTLFVPMRCSRVDFRFVSWKIWISFIFLSELVIVHCLQCGLFQTVSVLFIIAALTQMACFKIWTQMLVTFWEVGKTDCKTTCISIPKNRSGGVYVNLLITRYCSLMEIYSNNLRRYHFSSLFLWSIANMRFFFELAIFNKISCLDLSLLDFDEGATSCLCKTFSAQKLTI